VLSIDVGLLVVVMHDCVAVRAEDHPFVLPSLDLVVGHPLQLQGVVDLRSRPLAGLAALEVVVVFERRRVLAVSAADTARTQKPEHLHAVLAVPTC
jgi:hypothetical protein